MNPDHPIAPANVLTDAQSHFLGGIDRSHELASEASKWQRYAQWSRVFRAQFSDATPGQYQQAMTVIAARIGV
jgi:hypothetical protein